MPNTLPVATLPVAWDRSYMTNPPSTEGTVYEFNADLYNLLKDFMGPPPIQQAYHPSDGVTVFTQAPARAAFFGQEMIGGRLALGAPHDGQFAVKYFEIFEPFRAQFYRYPEKVPAFHIRYFDGTGLSSAQVYCNVTAKGLPVRAECHDITQATQVAEYPISADGLLAPMNMPTIYQLRGAILLAAFDELDTTPASQKFISQHRQEIMDLKARIEATQLSAPCNGSKCFAGLGHSLKLYSG